MSRATRAAGTVSPECMVITRPSGLPASVPVLAAAEYLALTLPGDAESTAECVGLPVERVARLRAESTAADVADLRRVLDLATRSVCVWSCRVCGEVGPYSPGLDHWWAHYMAVHHTGVRRRLDRVAAGAARSSRPPTPPRSAMVSYCGVAECAGVVDAQGLCRRHYQRWRRNGDPVLPRDRPTPVPSTQVPEFPRGLCRSEGANFFPEVETGREAAHAISVCLACPERVACARYAIDAHETGIWGATTTHERIAIRQSRTAGAA